MDSDNPGEDVHHVWSDSEHGNVCENAEEWDAKYIATCDPQTIASAMRVIQVARKKHQWIGDLDRPGFIACSCGKTNCEELLALRAWDQGK